MHCNDLRTLLQQCNLRLELCIVRGSLKHDLRLKYQHFIPFLFFCRYLCMFISSSRQHQTLVG